MRFFLFGVLFFVACAKPPPEVVEKPKANVINLYARLYDSQEVDDAERQYIPSLKEALVSHTHTIRIEAFTNADGEIESLGIDFQIDAAESETEALEILIKETLRIAGAPYATQIYVVNPGKD